MCSAQEEHLIWLAVANVSLIRNPKKFIETFLKDVCALREPGIIIENEEPEELYRRWGSGKTGYKLKGHWSNETTAIPATIQLNIYGAKGLEINWEYEEMTGIAGLYYDGPVKQSIQVSFGNENAREIFVSFFEKQTGQRPIFVEIEECRTD
jgi:hypothetical protein